MKVNGFSSALQPASVNLSRILIIHVWSVIPVLNSDWERETSHLLKVNTADNMPAELKAPQA
jgi:hypothetical protein